MKFHPTSETIGSALSAKEDFYVPRFQRSYAWQEPQLDDFFDDLGGLFEARSQKTPKAHFFGGILVVQAKVDGSSRRRWQIVDGQQRLTTFVLLGHAFLGALERSKTDAERSKPELVALLQELIDRNKTKWSTFNDFVNRQATPIRKLTLSEVDDSYFHNLLQGRPALPPKAQRWQSHERLLKAHELAEEFLAGLTKDLGVSERCERFSILEEVLSEDCQILRIDCETRNQAYRLFQVLNDRGSGLSEGDLLRVSTSEAVSESGANATQYIENIANLWDDILRDDFSHQEEHLRWYFAYRIGKTPNSADVHADYMEHVFKLKPGVGVKSAAEAEAVIAQVRDLADSVARIRALRRGEWPYEVTAATQWQKARLKYLVTLLKHDLSLPLLLALSKHCNEASFARACHALERFFFRYKLLCNGHISGPSSLYYKTASGLAGGGTYDEKVLFKKLQDFMDASAPANVCAEAIRNLSYEWSKPSVKYLLTILEEYFDSYKAGEKPLKVRDDTRLLDPLTITIEHIYPKNAQATSVVKDLEPAKNRIGNLTILARIPNQELGNSPFADKKEVYSRDTSHLTRHVAQLGVFDLAAFEKREQELVDASLKVLTL